MIIESDGTIKQVHLTEYQSEQLKWRRRERQWYYLFALWSLGFGIAIGLMLLK